MKIGIIALALAALIAAPVLAASDASAKTQVTKQTVKKAKHLRVVKRVRVPQAQYIQAQPQDPRFVHHPSYDAYVGGNYAGSDPDPRVRMQLRREYECDEMFSGC
jgi:hypothetical protein